MEWVELSKAIAELGILVIIAAVFIIFTIKTNKDAKDKNQQLFDFAMNQLQQQSNPHVLTEEEDSLANKIDRSINSYLQAAVRDLGANRAFVSRYHNGGKDMRGISFLKLSMTNEQVNLGRKPIQSEFQNQFRSIVAIICEEVEEKGFCYINNIEDIKDVDMGTYELLKMRKVRSCYTRGIKSPSGYIIGGLMIVYSEDNKNEPPIEKIDKYLSEKANQISTLLNFKEV